MEEGGDRAVGTVTAQAPHLTKTQDKSWDILRLEFNSAITGELPPTVPQLR